MQQILTNQKRFFHKNQVRNLRIPIWPELAVHRIWPQAIQLPNFKDYMPSDWSGNSKTERPFFWAILVTMAPEFAEQLVLDCRRQRLAS